MMKFEDVLHNGKLWSVTGGAIKLTHTMAERQHTLEELNKMEQVRNYLIDNGVFDSSGFKELNSEDA